MEADGVASVRTGYGHVVLEDGVPYIADTTMKLVELVTAQQAYGWSPEELAFQFPYLTLGQIHAALAYYWDHKAEVDADIERDLRYVEALRASTPEPPIVARLRAMRNRQ